MGGDPHTAPSAFSEAVQVSAEIGSASDLVDALQGICISKYRQGDLSDALLAADVALSLPSQVRTSHTEVALHLNRARILLLEGRTDEALQALDSAEKSRSQKASSLYQFHMLECYFSEYRGIAQLNRCDPEGALSYFKQSLDAHANLGTPINERAEIKLRQAEAYLDLNEFPRSHELCTEALASLDTKHEALEIGHLHRVRGIACHFMGRPKEAAQNLDQAEVALRRVGDRYELGRCLIDKATFLQDRDPGSRTADAAEAVNIFEQIGVSHLLQSAQDTLSMCEEKARRDRTKAFIPDEVGATKGVIAVSSAMKDILARGAIAARSEAAILITGETGTGKEVLARFVHEQSRRSEQPFVAVNIAAIPESLFEREFFGHAKGAYTGADRDRAGLVEEADGGTLFLDEIGEMPLHLQPKILRLLQEGTFRRVGETKERRASIRVVAATNRDLRTEMRKGDFREDLFYRIAVFQLRIPPLRERPEDTAALAKHFLDQESRTNRIAYWMDKDVWLRVKRYAWPGNARELQAVIRGIAAFAGPEGNIRLEHLPEELKVGPATEALATLDLGRNLEERERELVLEALRKAENHRTQAARFLGIGRNTLYEKMKRLGIQPESRD